MRWGYVSPAARPVRVRDSQVSGYSGLSDEDSRSRFCGPSLFTNGSIEGAEVRALHKRAMAVLSLFYAVTLPRIFAAQ